MRGWATPATFLLSATIHAVLLGTVASAAVPAKREPAVDVQINETVRPPVPPPPPQIQPEPVPPPRRLAALARQIAPAEREPSAPPPPNAPPPPSALRQAPVQIGISLSSTVEAGALALPAGNSLYGKAPEQAPDPAAVQPYRAEHYAPPAELAVLPEPIECNPPRDEYPDEARRIGFEGKVRLRLLVDAQGRVASAAVLDDPGHGLGAAAARSVPRHCRFRPGRRGEQAVATSIVYTVSYELQ